MASRQQGHRRIQEKTARIQREEQRRDIEKEKRIPPEKQRQNQ